METSPYDVELLQVVALLEHLPGLTAEVTIEPRVHPPDELTKEPVPPTYRVSCQLSERSSNLKLLDEIERAASVQCIVDPGGRVRFRSVES